MFKLLLIVLTTLLFIAPTNLIAQSKIDAEKIKTNKIRSAAKITTDLRASDNFTSKPVNTSIYNKDGLQSEFIKFDHNGNVEIHYFYKYDESGNTIEVIGLKADGSLGNKWVYEYDDNNNLIRQTSYRPDGVIGRDYVFGYDDNGMRIRELIYDSKQLIEQSEYVYEYYEPE